MKPQSAMKKRVKKALGLLAVMVLLTGLFSSCKSQDQYGCPGKITKARPAAEHSI